MKYEYNERFVGELFRTFHPEIITLIHFTGYDLGDSFTGHFLEEGAIAYHKRISLCYGIINRI